MSWWKGSGSSGSSTMPAPQNNDNSMLLMAMMAKMMGGMMESMQQPQPPPSIQMPEVRKVEDIDWSEKQAQLASKAKADYMTEQRKRKGVMDTVHTSPLLDDEEPTVTQNLIS
jgi:hypothetical protein